MRCRTKEERVLGYRSQVVNDFARFPRVREYLWRSKVSESTWTTAIGNGTLNSPRELDKGVLNVFGLPRCSTSHPGNISELCSIRFASFQMVDVTSLPLHHIFPPRLLMSFNSEFRKHEISCNTVRSENFESPIHDFHSVRRHFRATKRIQRSGE